MDYALFDDVREDLRTGKLNKQRCLFLEPHPDLIRQWEVNSPDATYLAVMDGTISRFGAVSPWRWREFKDAADRQGYTVVFYEDPKPVFDWIDSLNGPPGVEIQSGLEGRVNRKGEALRLINGFLPFQARGINFMQRTDSACYFQWSTGTGKVVAYEGTILTKMRSGYGLDGGRGFDVCFYVNGPNHLEGARRKLDWHTGLAATIIDGTKRRREKLLMETARAMRRNEQPILIFNAEKFREDTEGFQMLVEGRNVLFIFDEMNERYSNRTTQVYRATCEIMYDSYTPQGIPYPALGEERAAQMFCVAGSATPINRNPEGWFNQVRLLDPSIYGTTSDFSNLFVAERNQWFVPTKFKNLDLMSAMASHIVHQADKTRDPEIADQFPAKLPPETVFIELDPKQKKLYETLEKELDFAAMRAGTSLLTMDDLLAAIHCLQTICSHPKAVLKSARFRDEFDKAYEAEADRLLSEGMPGDTVEVMLDVWAKKNAHGSKIAQLLRGIIGDDKKFDILPTKLIELADRIDKHDGKVIVFTKDNEMSIPYIEEYLDERDITYVTYKGGISRAAGQEAIDSFRANEDIKVFLSTDAGRSSIDLPEASKTIHYDFPPVWYVILQRENRQDRIDSEQESVQVDTLTAPGTIEDRIAELVEIKRGYHEAIFGGEIAEAALEFSRTDYLYILTGERYTDDDQ